MHGTCQLYVQSTKKFKTHLLVIYSKSSSSLVIGIQWSIVTYQLCQQIYQYLNIIEQNYNYAKKMLFGFTVMRNNSNGYNKDQCKVILR